MPRSVTEVRYKDIATDCVSSVNKDYHMLIKIRASSVCTQYYEVFNNFLHVDYRLLHTENEVIHIQVATSLVCGHIDTQ